MLQCGGVRQTLRRWRTNDSMRLASRGIWASTRLCEDAAASSSTEPTVPTVDMAAIKLRNKQAAEDYNRRRASYHRQVTVARKSYANEVLQQKAADKAEQEALARKLTRRRLERQRLKNSKSAENAMRQKQLREQRQVEFEAHLELMQQRRDAKKEVFDQARQLVIDELEEEAPLWLTTADEVEAAFTPEAEQLLWARPGGVLGAPNPSLDAHFWQYETHTWHMDKTYQSKREVLLEELEERAYQEANVDAKFWTLERVEEQVALEEKVRLRAMVYSAGRAELLRKQRQMIDEQYATEPGQVPKVVPPPNNSILRNDKAIEQEGARLLTQDPTKFFVFDKSAQAAAMESESGAPNSKNYTGPTLGSPTGLRDPLREGTDRVFPALIGKFPKPDMRSEREKKQEEREERMLAAAQAEAHSSANDIELAAEQQTLEDLQPDLDYNDNDWDSDDEEWKEGLDPYADAEILETPRDRRWSEEDIDWAMASLQRKLQHLEKQFTLDVDNLKKKAANELREKSQEETSEEEEEEEDSSNEGSLDEALLSLSEAELVALSDLDDIYTEQMPADELAAAIKTIPGLTEEQIRFVLNRNRNE